MFDHTPSVNQLAYSYVTFLFPGTVNSLIELSAKAVAAHIPFAVVESYPEPIPEDLQLKIAFWSFPDSEEDIRFVKLSGSHRPTDLFA